MHFTITSSRPTILTLAHTFDVTPDEVVAALEARRIPISEFSIPKSKVVDLYFQLRRDGAIEDDS